MTNYDLLIASDHGGFALKGEIISYLRDHTKLKIKDFGTDSDKKVDYPDFAKVVVEAMLEGLSPRGILICSSGIGMSIAANRSSDIRAALCLNEDMAISSRQHNDANILVLGSKFTSPEAAFGIIGQFLSAEFEGGRHARRLRKIC